MNYLDLEGAPFDDEKATYDLTKHRYTILASYVKSEYGNGVFGKMTNDDVETLMNESSINTVKYIKSKGKRQNWDVAEYKIAKKNYMGRYLAREDFIEACLDYVKYAVRSGGDMLGDHHGVNLKNGTVIVDWAKLRRELKVSDNYKEVLMSGNDPLINEARLCYGVDPDDYRSDY